MSQPCPKCGVGLPEAALGGLCPKCVAEMALGDGPDAVSSAALELQFAEKVGDRIDRYKLLQQLGEGGCGTVYMAEQLEPVRRFVALKIIKLGMDTRQFVARFEAERQALALMDHPNIARVFDAGATETGRPYFVMELVRGLPITKYCDQNSLTNRERIALLLPICQAIQHAHEKGIVHRDLKPSNLLVTMHDPDRSGVPKVIDFGIAKATTDQRLTDKTLFTAFEQFIGTPAYMSPEQAEMSGLGIDQRSDIYSLGVLLYELLTGRPPFDPATLSRASLDEIRRIVREVEPIRPSTRLTSLADVELSEIARRRREQSPKLIHSIRGDLDWIVMKCLEKDRNCRYPTAQSLADELQRFLSGEPILTRPVGAVERLWRRCRRHPTVASLTASLMVTLISLLILLIVLTRNRNPSGAVGPAGIPPDALGVVVVDGKTFKQTYIGPGRGVAVDSQNNNYWAGKLWRTKVHGSGFIVRDGATDVAVEERSLGNSEDCPGGITLDSSNRIAWIMGQCGGRNDAIWAVNADTHQMIKEPIRGGGINGGPEAVNPATGRFYHCVNGVPMQVNPSTLAQTRSAFGPVFGVNPSANLLYAQGPNGSLQIVDGRPDPEVILTNVALPFAVIGGSLGLDAEHNRIYVPNARSNNIAIVDARAGGILGEVRLDPNVTTIVNLAFDPVSHRLYALAHSRKPSPETALHVIQGSAQKVIPLAPETSGPILNPALNKIYLWVGRDTADEPQAAAP